MWSAVVVPYFEPPPEINEWKIEQFWYEEILLFESIFQKYILNNNTFIWHWLTSTILIEFGYSALQ